MQVADQKHQYIAEYGPYRLSSPILTEREHDIGIRRCAGDSNNKIAKELCCSNSNSRHIFSNILDKIVPPAGWTDDEPPPRNVQGLIYYLMQRGELTLRVLTSVEVAWIASQAASLLKDVATTAPLSLNDKRCGGCND